MNEEFLQYLWRYHLFQNQINSSEGKNIEIIDTGEINYDAGPDFFNAKIRIDNTLWAGNVEIHINSSDWFKHKHHQNNSYNNIILHVVFEDDAIVRRKNGELIPCLELKGKFNKKLFFRYSDFMQSKSWIACEMQFPDVDPFIINNWLDILLIDRLKSKTELMDRKLSINKNNWEKTFYEYLASNFGFKVNSDAFELLAKSLSMKYLAKHKNSIFQLEAMLFGQAGLLNSNFIDEYPNQLFAEYQFLKNKFSIEPIDSHLWKFLRLRPSNFPTIRISQFAQLISKSSGLFSKVLESENIDDLKKLFDLNASEYWDTHYVFDKSSHRRKKRLGENSRNLIFINTIVPFLFLYGLKKGNYAFKEKALTLLENIKGENNAIIKKWKSLGLDVKTSAKTQALIELKNSYCQKKLCLHCRIGNFILKQTEVIDD
jgi:hypothetical protein